MHDVLWYCSLYYYKIMNKIQISFPYPLYNPKWEREMWLPCPETIRSPESMDSLVTLPVHALWRLGRFPGDFLFPKISSVLLLEIVGRFPKDFRKSDFRKAFGRRVWLCTRNGKLAGKERVGEHHLRRSLHRIYKGSVEL